MKKQKWADFRKTGLLLIINQILHIFGWAIVMVQEGDEITDCYPAKVNFRGFNGEDVDESYKSISKYIKNNIEDICISK